MAEARVSFSWFESFNQVDMLIPAIFLFSFSKNEKKEKNYFFHMIAFRSFHCLSYFGNTSVNIALNPKSAGCPASIPAALGGSFIKGSLR